MNRKDAAPIYADEWNNERFDDQIAVPMYDDEAEDTDEVDERANEWVNHGVAIRSASLNDPNRYVENDEVANTYAIDDKIDDLDDDIEPFDDLDDDIEPFDTDQEEEEDDNASIFVDAKPGYSIYMDDEGNVFDAQGNIIEDN